MPTYPKWRKRKLAEINLEPTPPAGKIGHTILQRREFRPAPKPGSEGGIKRRGAKRANK